MELAALGAAKPARALDSRAANANQPRRRATGKTGVIVLGEVATLR
jgi:hypothetical protein